MVDSTILLTGGLGYIGSHTAVELIDEGYKVIIVDNLSNTTKDVNDRIEKITGIRPALYIADVCDKEALREVFGKENIDTVIHFAGYKAVGESVQEPLKYYRNNLDSTLTLLEAMRENAVRKLIFSSSATVYGAGDDEPFREDHPTGDITNPYGWTKYMIEQILRDTSRAYPEMSMVLLRYFNPIGAHESGLIGEKPNGIPNNLMPYITQTAAGIRERLNVFGDDYETPDGTGVRDFIHVVDLARGHVAAVKYADYHMGTEVFNLGTGKGTSVLELVNTFSEVNDIDVPYTITDRRPGDIAICYADPTKAKVRMNWEAKKDISDMCRDSWRWEQARDNQNIVQGKRNEAI